METKNGFDFQKFINDSRDVLLNPKDFFSRIELSGGLGEPVIRALIYGAIAGLFSMIWSFMNIGGLFGSATGIGLFFTTIIGALIGAFIMGILILIISSICGGNTDYEPNFRVAVAIMVFLPISSFLSVIGGLSYWLSTLVSLAINLYALYVLYYALFVALSGKEQTAKVLGYVLGGFLIFIMLIGAITNRAVKKFSGFSKNRIEESLKGLEKAAKEIEKETTAHYDEMLEELEKVEEHVAVLEEEETQKEVELADPEAKPEKYPQDAIEYAEDWFSKDESDFSAETITNLIKLMKELKKYDKSQRDEMLDVLSNYGYDDIEEYTNDAKKAIISPKALKTLESLQLLIDATDEEQKVAEDYTLDKAIESVVQQSLKEGNLTQEDIRLAYENWDKLTEYSELTKTK
jgi:hypothetical protein